MNELAFSCPASSSLQPRHPHRPTAVWRLAEEEDFEDPDFFDDEDDDLDDDEDDDFFDDEDDELFDDDDEEEFDDEELDED